MSDISEEKNIEYVWSELQQIFTLIHCLCWSVSDTGHVMSNSILYKNFDEKTKPNTRLRLDSSVRDI